MTRKGEELSPQAVGSVCCWGLVGAWSCRAGESHWSWSFPPLTEPLQQALQDRKQGGHVPWWGSCGRGPCIRWADLRSLSFVLHVRENPQRV